jgi:cystathionine beta-lyase/cystathionine gamma-synthase
VALGHGHRVAVVVDNTFASPALLRPTEFGADLVVHSATKYLSGHDRVLAGTLAGRIEQLRVERECSSALHLAAVESRPAPPVRRDRGRGGPDSRTGPSLVAATR